LSASPSSVKAPNLGHGRLVAGTAAQARLRWAGAETTGVVEDARRRLDLSPLAAAALGRLMTGAAIHRHLSAPHTVHLVMEARGDGPLGSVLAEVDREGRLRGTVRNPRVDLPRTVSGKLPVGQGLGQGVLRVSREFGDESFQSQVELVSGEIGDDLAHYLEQSEQTRSAVLLGVLTRSEGVVAAGGLIVEALPDATEADLDRLQENLAALGSVSRPIETGGFDALLGAVLAGLDPASSEEHALRYECRCSRARLADHLGGLPPEDLVALEDERGEVVAECVFCGTAYRYTRAELAG
jgi:molecular chaperone Hsp33